ncbi:AAA family ATPase [Sandarakinorhabdus sp.]|uniref:AAA family ATPase n=1 Tax=Sandarakinorhabdus sp. TaxID=1916663 RepID=UPI00286D9AD6|nr:AAA family ATPase [Sandarakinorhabdus sp.]
MTVRDSATGDDIIIHSFAGEDWKAIKDAWRIDGTLPERPAPSSPAQVSRGPGRTVASFDYRQADGEIAFRIDRVEPGRNGRRKDFKVSHPAGPGRWAAGLNGFAPLPYRLPDLIASDPYEPVFIVEGEKKADALAALDLLATCNPFGAGKWRADFAPYFEGRRVFILPDNDPPGRAHADDVARQLAASAATVARIDLPGLPDKGDILDWLAAGGSAEALLDLCAAQPAVKPLALPIVCPADWEGREPPVREWLIEGWLARGSAAFLTGDGGVGKSLFTQQLATSLAAGVDCLGLPVAQTVALYVTCEDDMHELHRRQAAINARLGLSMRDLAGRLFLVSLKGELGSELVNFDAAGALELSQRYRDLESTARAIGAGFVAIDNVAQTFTGNENVRNQVAGFCNVMDRLAMAIGGTVLFLGHPSKAGAEFSGSTGWEAHVRQRLYLDWLDKGAGVSGDRDGRVLRRSKANYARAGAELDFRWHAGAFVLPSSLPSDAGFDDEAAAQTELEERTFLRCLAIRTGQKRPVSHSQNAANFAPKVFAKMPEGRRVGGTALAAAMERLMRTGLVERATADDPLWRGEDRKPVLGLRERQPE